MTNTANSGVGSLRTTLQSASPNDTIVFSPGLSGATIILTSGSLTINTSVTIDASDLTLPIRISGNNNNRVLDIGTSGNVTLRSLVIADGTANTPGGGIRNAGRLVLEEVTVTNNRTTGDFNHGGGIYNAGTGNLTINRSTISNNTASANGNGGGLKNDFGTVQITNSTFSGNRAGQPFNVVHSIIPV
ncbi:MAG: hypothetical protein LR015_12755 [Verrucomicrobia bacterium]|nr:hypothetical protein [Verrucomicrobiota bacterium]